MDSTSETQKRPLDDAKVRYAADMIEQAPKMLELAERALEVVQAMMALEAELKVKNGDRCTVFSCDDGNTFEDAESAICYARYHAERIMMRAKKAKNDVV